MGDHNACISLVAKGRDRLRQHLSDGYGQFTVFFVGYMAETVGHEQMISHIAETSGNVGVRLPRSPG